jgi:hypothetical protein
MGGELHSAQIIVVKSQIAIPKSQTNPNLDKVAKSRKTLMTVIPAEAGIQ